MRVLIIELSAKSLPVELEFVARIKCAARRRNVPDDCCNTRIVKTAK